MNVSRLLLAPCFAAVLFAADDGVASGDPFAAYHQSIESRLSQMLEHQQTQLDKVSENPPNQQSASPIESNEVDTKAFAHRFWGGHEAGFIAALDRLQRLRPMLEPILDYVGVPRQLAAVVLIESGAQPLATSPRQARGLWQFTPETARQYGLTVNGRKDERVQLESATRAAARYLRDLYGFFRDWPLALAAYNAGQNAVAGALEEGKVSTFWQISSAGLLPRETLDYVPAVLAAMQLLGSPEPATAAAVKSQSSAWVYASTGVVERE